MRYKVGDLVKVIYADLCGANGYYENGDILEVHAIAFPEDGEDAVLETKDRRYLYAKEVELHEKAEDRGFAEGIEEGLQQALDGRTRTTVYDGDIPAYSQEAQAYADTPMAKMLDEMAAKLREEEAIAELSNGGDFMVEHPNHYTQGKYETIDVIAHTVSGYTDPFVAHCVGTATKYLNRAPHKHETPLEDIKKARKYLEFAQEHLEGKR